ncbi:hypothetical protein ABPG72_017006 [Tetrahymena utriculariae]
MVNIFVLKNFVIQNFKKLNQFKLLFLNYSPFGQILQNQLNIIYTKYNNRIPLPFINLQRVTYSTICDFPSASPDLNPIENIWAYIKHILAKKSLTNLKDLEEEIIKIWDNLDQEIIDNCIDSMSTRLQKCIELQGRMTEY